MWRFLFRIWRWFRAEIVFGFLIASVFWAGVLGWQATYAPTDAEKQKCYETAEAANHKAEGCKTFWERATSDPVAFFTLWLVVFTGGLTISTVMLWLAGEKQARHARRSAAVQSRDMQASIAAAEASARAAQATADAIQITERPYIFIWGPVGHHPKTIYTSSTDPTFQKIIQDDAAFVYNISNRGKLAAVIERVSIACGYEMNGRYPPPIIIGDHPLLSIPIISSEKDVPNLSHTVPWNDWTARIMAPV